MAPLPTILGEGEKFCIVSNLLFIYSFIYLFIYYNLMAIN